VGYGQSVRPPRVKVASWCEADQTIEVMGHSAVNASLQGHRGWGARSVRPGRALASGAGNIEQL